MPDCKTFCPECGGNGWIIEPRHTNQCTPEHCSSGCPEPEQVQCPKCKGIGMIECEPDNTNQIHGNQ